MAEKEGPYKLIKIAGVAAFIPLLLASGPVAGYLAGEYFVKQFNAGAWVYYICIGTGFLASLIEIIRLVKFVLLVDKKP
ncbi:MAG: hypothetical protein WC695_06880 [Candidatus Omnitrophota bacterium]